MLGDKEKEQKESKRLVVGVYDTHIAMVLNESYAADFSSSSGTSGSVEGKTHSKAL